MGSPGNSSEVTYQFRCSQFRVRAAQAAEDQLLLRPPKNAAAASATAQGLAYPRASPDLKYAWHTFARSAEVSVGLTGGD